MPPEARRLAFLPLFTLMLCLATASARAMCYDPFSRQGAMPDFEFVMSKPHQVAPGEVTVRPTALRDSFTLTAEVSAGTALEVNGTKKSQRSEILESATSSGISDGGHWLCYEWAMAVPKDTTLPEPGGARAKLTVAQFHQDRSPDRDDPSVLFIDLDPDGNLVAVFNDAVGRRSSVLVPGGPAGDAVLGKTWELSVSALWSTDHTGRVLISVREKGAGAFRQVMSDSGQNSTTGHVYLKLGLYRHNIERDQTFARSTTRIVYSDIRRNGMKATYSGTMADPGTPSVTAPAPAPTTTTTTTALAPTPIPAPTSTSTSTTQTASAPVAKRIMGGPLVQRMLRSQPGGNATRKRTARKAGGGTNRLCRVGGFGGGLAFCSRASGR